MNEIYDVIVAGGGPAGLLAAKTCAEFGLSVCLCDLHKDYEHVLRACSAQLILDDGYESEYIKVEDGKLRFTYSDFLVPYTGKFVEVKNKYYYSPVGNRIHFAKPDQSAFALKFDKQKLLKDIAVECMEKGVHMFLNTVVIKGEDCGRYVDLTVRRDGIEHKLRGKKLIIAEGVNARLTRQFHIMKDRKRFTKAAVNKFFVENISGIEPNSWNLYYGLAYHCYSPVIIGPSMLGDYISEVTISASPKNSGDEIYYKFTTDSPMKKSFDNAKIIFKEGCAVTAYESLKTPYKGNVISIGDSAAFVEVEVQGAFMCGFYAALAVRLELAGKHGFELYCDWWRKVFEFNSDEYLRVSQGYALVPTYTDEELDYLFGLISNTTLEGTYSQYKTPKLIWDEINRHIEEIRHENQGLFEKIQKNNEMTLTKSFEKK